MVKEEEAGVHEVCEREGEEEMMEEEPVPLSALGAVG